jgi:hypothetical protein
LQGRHRCFSLTKKVYFFGGRKESSLEKTKRPSHRHSPKSATTLHFSDFVTEQKQKETSDKNQFPFGKKGCGRLIRDGDIPFFRRETVEKEKWRRFLWEKK